MQLPVKNIEKKLIDIAMIPMRFFDDHFKDGGIDLTDIFRIAGIATLTCD